MALNDTGFRPNRYTEIAETLNQTIQNDFGNVMDLSEDALMGVYSGIMALAETQIEELSQGVYDSANILSAEGTMLDNLALLAGFVRLPASNTRGIVWFTGEDGTTIPEGTLVESIVGDLFGVDDETTITATNCVDIQILIDNLQQGQSYTLNAGEIGGTNTYKREATPNQTKLEILTDLRELLLADEEFVNTTVDDTDPLEPILRIPKLTTTESMSVSGGSYFLFRDIVTATLVTANVSGNVAADAFTITKLRTGTSITGVTGVSNPTSLTRGRDIETDRELRVRVINSYTAVSGGTADAIQQAVLAVDGVTSSKVVENDTSETTGTPRFLPPKSFQVTVEGGDSTLIAEAIWSNKPAGIHCYSDPNNPLTVQATMQDYNSQEHIVLFARPSNKFIWIHADYNLYDEEVFPESGESIMREELAAFGQTLAIGQDVIPDRFYPSIYRNVSGVDDVNIYIAETDNINNVPTFPDSYQMTTIDVDDETVTNFSAFGNPPRVTVQGYGNDPLPVYP